MKGIEAVKKKIGLSFDRRKAAVFALCRFYAARVLIYFQEKQLGSKNGEWWDNQTFQAAHRVFADAFESGNVVGWFIAHGVDYGVWLTVANDRAHDALTPIIKKFLPEFQADLKKIYHG